MGRAVEDTHMPIYEYLCQDCGLLSQKMRKMAERDNAFKCPECGSDNTKKAMSAPAAHIPVDGHNLRGSGKADMDRLIGQSAERRWAQIEGEAKKKEAARKEFGQQALGRSEDGSYKPVPKKHIENRKKAMKKFEHAQKHGTKIVHDG